MNFSFSNKTEIAQFKDPGSKKNYNGSQVVYFVISRPPENMDSLISLVSRHFQSFAPDDTINKYYHYNHKYYIEHYSTRRGYIEKRKGYSFSEDYLHGRSDDLLVRITVEPEYNEQEIIIYKPNLKVVKEIRKKWREK
ncbi:MAG: hypothetical protein LBH25_12965 [Fibromonadaceae bacterium]|jgi:hypothetical protein|nr:hypothetical protein [Fibromonadaceae bacterium]